MSEYLTPAPDVATPQEWDQGKRAAVEIGNALRERKGAWQRLSMDALTDLLIEPGTRGVPGSDEMSDVLAKLNRFNKTMRDACSFKTRMIGGHLDAVYSSDMRR